MTARATVLVFALLLSAQADTLILKDGTRVTGRWWAVDAGHVHFLVDNQLQHYPRSDVSAVTFGDATLPPPPPAAPAQPSPSAAPPAPAPARRRGLSEPEEIGAVYYWNGRDLSPLERNQAVERGRGSNQYYEMPAPQSRVRVKAAPELVFVVRLPKGVNPASFSLFPLVTVNGARRTEAQPGRRGGLVTWPYDIATVDESGYMTYTLTVKDLPTGDYSFSPSTSNDGYCFGVDPGAPGR